MNAAAQVLEEAEKLKTEAADTTRGANAAWLSRQKLQDAYQKLLIMDLEFALDKKVEQELWNHAFKNQINTLQNQAKDKQNAKRGEVQASLNLFLETASGFYLQLCQEMCSAFKLDLPFRRQASCIGIIKEYGGPGLVKINPPKRSSCLYVCQHCLVHLGDIARYRQQIDQAQVYYRHAARLVPYNGHPYNQLAILEAAKGNKLSTIFFYVRSIAVKHPFPVASTNLDKFYAKISKDCHELRQKLTVSELISTFLQLQAYAHLCIEVSKARGHADRILSNLPSHISAVSLSSFQLVQMVALNLYALYHVRRKLASAPNIATATTNQSSLSNKGTPLSTRDKYSALGTKECLTTKEGSLASKDRSMVQDEMNVVSPMTTPVGSPVEVAMVTPFAPKFTSQAVVSATDLISNAVLLNGEGEGGGGETRSGERGGGVASRRVSRGGEETGGGVIPTRLELQTCQDLMLQFTVSLFDTLLQSTLKQDTKPIGYQTVAAIKLVLDWLRSNSTDLDHPIVKHSTMWIHLARLLNTLQSGLGSADTDAQLQKYDKTPLPEDCDLECFLPISKALSELDFETWQPRPLPEPLELSLRCRRLVAACCWIADEFSRLELLSAQRQSSGIIKFSTPQRPQSGVNADGSAERKSTRQNVALQAIMQKREVATSELNKKFLNDVTNKSEQTKATKSLSKKVVNTPDRSESDIASPRPAPHNAPDPRSTPPAASASFLLDAVQNGGLVGAPGGPWPPPRDLIDHLSQSSGGSAMSAASELNNLGFFVGGSVPSPGAMTATPPNQIFSFLPQGPQGTMLPPAAGREERNVEAGKSDVNRNSFTDTAKGFQNAFGGTGFEDQFPMLYQGNGGGNTPHAQWEGFPMLNHGGFYRPTTAGIPRHQLITQSGMVVKRAGDGVGGPGEHMPPHGTHPIPRLQWPPMEQGSNDALLRNAKQEIKSSGAITSTNTTFGYASGLSQGEGQRGVSAEATQGVLTHPAQQLFAYPTSMQNPVEPASQKVLGFSQALQHQPVFSQTSQPGFSQALPSSFGNQSSFSQSLHLGFSPALQHQAEFAQSASENRGFSGASQRYQGFSQSALQDYDLSLQQQQTGFSQAQQLPGFSGERSPGFQHKNQMPFGFSQPNELQPRFVNSAQSIFSPPASHHRLSHSIPLQQPPVLSRHHDEFPQSPQIQSFPASTGGQSGFFFGFPQSSQSEPGFSQSLQTHAGYQSSNQCHPSLSKPSQNTQDFQLSAQNQRNFLGASLNPVEFLPSDQRHQNFPQSLQNFLQPTANPESLGEPFHSSASGSVSQSMKEDFVPLLSRQADHSGKFGRQEQTTQRFFTPQFEQQQQKERQLGLEEQTRMLDCLLAVGSNSSKVDSSLQFNSEGFHSARFIPGKVSLEDVERESIAAAVIREREIRDAKAMPVGTVVPRTMSGPHPTSSNPSGGASDQSHQSQQQHQQQQQQQQQQQASTGSTYSLFSQSPWPIDFRQQQQTQQHQQQQTQQTDSISPASGAFTSRVGADANSRMGGAVGSTGPPSWPLNNGPWNTASGPVGHSLIGSRSAGGANVITNDIQSMWQGGPSPLEKLLEQQKQQRQSEPR